MKNGEAAASGCTAEQTSCKKSGSVSSAERAPPPIVAFASRTNTDCPARAKVIAAARPFGPEPTTTVSHSSATDDAVKDSAGFSNQTNESEFAAAQRAN